MSRVSLFSYFFVMSFFVVSCSKKTDIEYVYPSILAPVAETGTLFPFSITSNDIDFIKDNDPDAFEKLSFVGQSRKEMPNSLSEILFDESAYIFKAEFDGGEEVEIWCHSSFGNQQAAQEYAEKLCPRLGKLPKIQREMLTHVIIHNDDATAFAEKDFFVLYSENMDKRIITNDLEETVFHESIHSSLQVIHENTTDWKLAQVADRNFITDYALRNPSLEDMPESAIFAFTVIKYPGRLSPEIEKWVKDYIPNRLAFFKTIYE